MEDDPTEVRIRTQRAPAHRTRRPGRGLDPERRSPGHALGNARSSGPAAAPTQTPPFNGIAHIAIRVQSIADSLAFYNKLGFQQAFANTGRGGSVSQSFVKINDKQFIELYPVAPPNPARPQSAAQSTSSFLHLCFEAADINATHDFYVAEGLAPRAVETAGAGNLLFTLRGPQQPTFAQNIEYTQYMPTSRHTLDIGQHLSPDRVADKMTVVTLAMQALPPPATST